VTRRDEGHYISHIPCYSSVSAAGPSRQHVAWDEDVIDNEGCGRKSSKGTLFVDCVMSFADVPRWFHVEIVASTVSLRSSTSW
jgi:hypothetical protein